MRSATICLVLAAVIVGAFALPYPQNFDEAVKQAQQMSLIPAGAQIDRTFSGNQVKFPDNSITVQEQFHCKESAHFFVVND
jgi:hypothetical protein